MFTNIYFRWFLCAVLIVLALWFLAVCDATELTEGEGADEGVLEQKQQRRAGRNMGLNRRLGASSPQMMSR